MNKHVSYEGLTRFRYIQMKVRYIITCLLGSNSFAIAYIFGGESVENCPIILKAKLKYGSKLICTSIFET